PGRKFKGTLVRTADSIDPASRTLLVEVDVDNPARELLPGSYAEVHLQVPADNPAFILPVSTLIFRSRGLQVATVDANNRAALRDITLGRDLGNEVEVVSGVSAADSIIETPPDSLVTGEAVRIVAAASIPQREPAGNSQE
ncbi:MAG TPA: hypothetical protein VGR97_14760, partial [Candidatus Acidoferrales bacterium]|nr:hypothetical protein [Candidatus Acidoferrales bacterium]